MKHIKDPIHGYIDVPEEELSIINTPEFQRLRRIKQLGLSDTVYPSATHTRFTHSLGVMYLSTQMCESLGVSSNIKKINQIAGLLHDIGHLPFSHTLEKILNDRTGLTHEDISCEYIDKLEKRDSVTFPVEPSSVKSVIKSETNVINTIANDIDADRLDYLVRDSYYTGINFGKIELDTLLKFAQIIDGKIGFDYKSLNSVERVLDARMQMNYSVYAHDTVIITESMLRRAVEKYLDSTNTAILDLVGKDDSELQYDLLNSDVQESIDLFNAIQNRNLYKVCYNEPLREITKEDMESISSVFSEPQIHEKRIADMCGLSSTEVIISPPKPPSEDELDIPIEVSKRKVVPISEISSKPDSLRESSMLQENLLVFSPEPHREIVSEAASTYIHTLDNVSM